MTPTEQLLRNIRQDFADALGGVDSFLASDARPKSAHEFKYFEDRREHFTRRIEEIDAALAGTGEIDRLRSIIKKFMAVAMDVPISEWGDLPVQSVVGTVPPVAVWTDKG